MDYVKLYQKAQNASFISVLIITLGLILLGSYPHLKQEIVMSSVALSTVFALRSSILVQKAHKSIDEFVQAQRVCVSLKKSYIYLNNVFRFIYGFLALLLMLTLGY